MLRLVVEVNVYVLLISLNSKKNSTLFSKCLLKTFPTEIIVGTVCPVSCDFNGCSTLTVQR